MRLAKLYKSWMALLPLSLLWLGSGGAIPGLAQLIAQEPPLEARTGSDRLSGRNWEFYAQLAQLRLTLPTGSAPRFFLLARPMRIAIDFPTTESIDPQEYVISAADSAIEKLVIASQDQGLVRLVLFLKPGVELQPEQVALQQVDPQRWLVTPLIVNPPRSQPSTLAQQAPTQVTPSPQAPVPNSLSATQLAPAPRFSIYDPTNSASIPTPQDLAPAMPGESADPNLAIATELDANNTSRSIIEQSFAQPQNTRDLQPFRTNTVQPIQENAVAPSVPQTPTLDTRPPVPAAPLNPNLQPQEIAQSPVGAASPGPAGTETEEAIITQPLAAQPIRVTPPSISIPTQPADTPTALAKADSTPQPIAPLVEPQSRELPATEPQSAVDSPPVELRFIEAKPVATPVTPPQPIAVSIPEAATSTPLAIANNVTEPPAARPPVKLEAVPLAPVVEEPFRAPTPTSAEVTVPSSPPPASSVTPTALPAIGQPPVPTVPVLPPVPTVQFGEALPLKGDQDNTPSISPPVPSALSENPSDLKPLPMTATGLPNASPSTVVNVPAQPEAPPSFTSPGSTSLSTTVQLEAGSPITVQYTGTEPLKLSAGETWQDVLIVAEPVRSLQGQIIIPAGSEVLGRFETDWRGSRFIAQAISLSTAHRTLEAESDRISSHRSPRALNLGAGTGTGAIAGTLIAGGFGALGGAALGATTGYFTSPRSATIEPQQTLTIYLEEDWLLTD